MIRNFFTAICKASALNPNRSLDFGEIARLCHAACFSPSRRRSGLRRGVARIRMRTEAGKMPESLTFPIKNGLGVSNDRFGLKLKFEDCYTEMSAHSHHSLILLINSVAVMSRIKVKPNHFLPKSLMGAPMWYTSLSTSKKRPCALLNCFISMSGYWAL